MRRILPIAVCIAAAAALATGSADIYADTTGGQAPSVGARVSLETGSIDVVGAAGQAVIAHDLTGAHVADGVATSTLSAVPLHSAPATSEVIVSVSSGETVAAGPEWAWE